MDILNLDDLVNNPVPRVPVCLCIDSSFSMSRVVGGTTKSTGRTVYQDGIMWNIVEGGTSAIDELREGVLNLYEELRSDEVAQYSAEICIVTFNGQGARLVMDFAGINQQQELPQFDAAGDTPMGEGVNMALDCLEKRKKEYQDKGVDYFQPWLVLMTDGAPEGSDPVELERAITRTVSMIQAKKLTIFPIGIGPEADMKTLGRFSPKRDPLKLQGFKFREFFRWLSSSVARTSMSIPGEKVELDKEGIKGWAEL